MEDPLGQAVSEVIKPLLTECSLHHPLYQLESSHGSRETAAKIFATRSDAFISSNFITQSVALDESNNKVFCDVRRTISIRHLPLGKAQLRSLIMLELMAGGDGRFYISRWEELLQPDDLTALLFLPGAKFVMNGLRSLAAIAASLPSGLFGYSQQASRSDEESTTGLNGKVDHSK